MKIADRAIRTLFPIGALLTLAAVPGHAEDDNNLIRPTVTVSVQGAASAGGGPVHYKWRSSDGQIKDVDAPSTTWKLPSGPGVHFAYVLVSDSLGGYTEGRVLVNTDDVGGMPESSAMSPRALDAPAAPGPGSTDTFRGFFNMYGAPAPGALVYAVDTTTLARYPGSNTATTGADGAFTLYKIPYSAQFTLSCSFDGGMTFTSQCTGSDASSMFAVSARSHYSNGFSWNGLSISGRITLADGSPCGVDNDLFGVYSAGTATVLDASNNVLATARLNQFGSWGAPLSASQAAAAVQFQCEGASYTYTITSPTSGTNVVVPDMNVPAPVFAATGQPAIGGMTAPLNGRNGIYLAEPVRRAPPVPAAGTPVTLSGWNSLDFSLNTPPYAAPVFPADYQSREDTFLAEKGHDSRMSACQYYKAIGAAKGCGADGSLKGAVSYEDWKRAVKIEKYARSGGVKASATYINRTDLNLTRQQESIRYGTGSLAAVVCNHLGPSDQNASPDAFQNPAVDTSPSAAFPGATTADDAVANAIAGKNLVACVAMDYQENHGVNGNQKFVRFYIFGPSGQLLPSVNLDGRGEKFMPGSCTACHGGDHYAGSFPADGSGQADFGGHMLPYDSGNFTFSNADGLTPSQRDDAIYGLNQNLLRVDPVSTPAVVDGALTLAGQDLIHGWYSNPLLPPHQLDPDYTPDTWKQEGTSELASLGTDYATPFYKKAIARTCRTCHVNQISGLNFDIQSVVTSNSYFAPNTVPPARQNDIVLPDAGFDFSTTVCGDDGFDDTEVWRRLQMPNSQVTFNRFWLSQGTTDSSGNSTDMPQLMANYFNNGISDGLYFCGYNSAPTITP